MEKDKEDFPIFVPLVKDIEKVFYVQNEESWEFLKNVKMEKNDIIISTYPKTGTTAVIHICHLIKGGDMNFKCQYDVSPFLEVIWNLNISEYYLFGRPGLFKSHMSLPYLFSIYGKDRKIITTLRNPENIIKSYYQFFLEKVKREFTFEEFEEFIEEKKPFDKNSIEYMYDVFKCRKLPNVCLVLYEDLLEDDLKIKSVKRISEFMGIKNYDLDFVMKMSSKEEMIMHESKFDDSNALKVFEQNGRVHHLESLPGKKITDSKHQSALKLTSKMIEKHALRWAATFGKEGIKNYEQLALLIKSEQE